MDASGIRRPRRAATTALVAVLLLAAVPGPVAGQDATGDVVVRAVLFYSPTCPHCREVMERHLPALLERFAGRLDIATFGTHTELGATLYAEAIRGYALPPDRRGVPMLLVGDRVLLGSGEIPALLPGLVERGLADGGVDWPALPTLNSMVAAAPEAEAPGASGAEPGDAGPLARFARDPGGNTLSVAVLLLVLLPAAVTSLLAVAGVRRPPREWHGWVLPGSLLVGIAASAYLGWTETTGAPLTCGPVGHCDVVQASPYATLFAVLPVAVLGVAAYAGLLALWVGGRWGPARWRTPARTATWALAFVGTVFSIYLTTLEPFVIGATCAWCVTSAVAMALALRAATPPVAARGGAEPGGP